MSTGPTFFPYPGMDDAVQIHLDPNSYNGLVLVKYRL